MTILPTERSGYDQRSLVISLETVQREGLRMLFRAAPAKVADALGVRVMECATELYLGTREMPGIQFNKIVGFGIDGPVTPARLDVAAGWLRQCCPAGSMLMLPPLEASPHLASWLAERGFERHAIDVSVFHLPDDAALDLPPPADIQVRAVSPHQASLFGRVISDGLGKTPAYAEWPAALVGQPGVTAYLAYDGPTAIGGAALFVSGVRAWLFLAASMPAYRKRGAQTALLAHRIKSGRDAGAKTFSVEVLRPVAGHDNMFASYRNVRRAGFELAYQRPNYRLSLP